MPCGGLPRPAACEHAARLITPNIMPQHLNRILVGASSGSALFSARQLLGAMAAPAPAGCRGLPGGSAAGPVLQGRCQQVLCGRDAGRGPHPGLSGGLHPYVAGVWMLPWLCAGCSSCTRRLQLRLSRKTLCTPSLLMRNPASCSAITQSGKMHCGAASETLQGTVVRLQAYLEGPTPCAHVHGPRQS